MRHLPFVLAAIVLLSGCDWVKMDQGAAQVRVVPLGQALGSCRRLGEVEVSVQDRVGPYERNSLAVRDELETLARNEALTLHADTVQPVAEPADGQQHWVTYRCKGNL